MLVIRGSVWAAKSLVANSPLNVRACCVCGPRSLASLSTLRFSSCPRSDLRPTQKTITFWWVGCVFLLWLVYIVQIVFIALLCDRWWCERVHVCASTFALYWDSLRPLPSTEPKCIDKTEMLYQAEIFHSAGDSSFFLIRHVLDEPIRSAAWLGRGWTEMIVGHSHTHTWGTDRRGIGNFQF